MQGTVAEQSVAAFAVMSSLGANLNFSLKLDEKKFFFPSYEVYHKRNCLDRNKTNRCILVEVIRGINKTQHLIALEKFHTCKYIPNLNLLCMIKPVRYRNSHRLCTDHQMI